MSRPRRTLAQPTEHFAGVGLHSGAEAVIRVLPAEPGSGIVFRDLVTGQEIPARASNVVDTSRCTILGAERVSVQTVEHLLSALSGLGVDDAQIETRGGELPAADGSAAPFVHLLQQAGLRDRAGAPPVKPWAPKRPFLLSGEGGASIAVLPAATFQATVVLDYPAHPWIGTQCVQWAAGMGDYPTQIAPARTYGFYSEIQWLQARGLALGASHETGIALREDGYDATLRFADELVRHKLLDLIGDLSLIGRPLAAHVIALKPSHMLNCRLAGLLAGEVD